MCWHIWCKTSLDTQKQCSVKPVCSPGESANRQIVEGTREEVAHGALHGVIAGAALEEAGHALRAVGKG